MSALDLDAIDAALKVLAPALPLHVSEDSAIYHVGNSVDPITSGDEQDRAAAYVAVMNAASDIVAEVRRLRAVAAAERRARKADNAIVVARAMAEFSASEASVAAYQKAADEALAAIRALRSLGVDP